jgi:crossover junction endodeoxyribonuclease RuvC
MTRVLGCDPGLNGAVVLWDDDLDALIIKDAPTLQIKVGKATARTIYNDAEYARIIRELAPDRANVEQVGGITGQSASASFNFGAGYGLLRGILATLQVPVTFIPPAVWQARLRVPPGKDGSRLRASQIFPAYAQMFARKKDDGRSDAALIARCMG